VSYYETVAPPAEAPVGTLPERVDLTLYRGDDFHLDVTVTKADGTPLDLAGIVPTAQVRETPDAADPPLATFLVTVTDNVIGLHLTHLEAALLDDTPAVWDLQLNDAAGGITTLVRGSVAVTLDVTRP
jgi:hypothetical protein